VGDRLSIPPVRARGVLSRVPPSLAVAVVAGLLAMVTFLVATGTRSGTQVAVAGADVPAGQPLERSGLRYVDVNASPQVLSTLVSVGDLGALRGYVATHTIRAGTVISRSDLTPPAAAAAQRSMSFPIDTEHAVGGALRPGDVVDVIDGAPESATGPVYVLTGAEVLAVGRQSTGALSGGSKYSLTVAVDADSGLGLAAAVAHGKVEVVRASGAVPASPTAAPPGAGERRAAPGVGAGAP